MKKPAWWAGLGIFGPVVAAAVSTIIAEALAPTANRPQNDRVFEYILTVWLLGCLAWFLGVFLSFRSGLRSSLGWAILGAVGGPVLACLVGVVTGALIQEAPFSGNKRSITEAAVLHGELLVFLCGWFAIPGLICGIITSRLLMRRRPVNKGGQEDAPG